MPRVQDALPSLDCRAWKGRSNPLLLNPLRFAPESRTGHCEGKVRVRDHSNRKRLRHLPQFGNPLSAQGERQALSVYETGQYRSWGVGRDDTTHSADREGVLETEVVRDSAISGPPARGCC